jgi:hypothetical protein
MGEVARALQAAKSGVQLAEADRELLALYGASYRVVMERLNPDGCGVASWPALCAGADELRSWAATQEQPLREAYELAITDNVERASAVVENQRRGARMSDLYETIPRPPPPSR